MHANTHQNLLGQTLFFNLIYLISCGLFSLSSYVCLPALYLARQSPSTGHLQSRVSLTSLPLSVGLSMLYSPEI